MRPRVQRAPGLPCALLLLGAELFANLGQNHVAGTMTHIPSSLRTQSVGWAKRSVPTNYVHNKGWWARRKCAFAHPTRTFVKAPLQIQPEHPDGIAAGNLGEGQFVHALHARDMADRIIFGHVERIVGAHHDAIGTEHVDQVS
jgi:hypothetical protein